MKASAKSDQGLKVMKFGGGCLMDAARFLQAAKIIAHEKQPTAVVVSAISGITNLIIDSIQNARISEFNIPEIIKTIHDKHYQIIRKAVKNAAIRRDLQEEINLRLKKLERLYFGVAYTHEITDSVHALILSYGERLAALVLAAVLASEGRPAVALDSDQIGIITDESLQNATADLDAIRDNFSATVMPYFKQGTIPVISGYFGCTRSGRTTTFGRNGTDYSAAVVAYGIGASSLEIWKDVDGFMSADPKMVKNAHKIDHLSYYEAAELSYFGAKILHPRTMEPIMQRNMPIYIKNVDYPDNAGTIIHADAFESDAVLKSVTCNHKIAALRIFGAGVGNKPGIIADVGTTLARIGINIYSVVTSQTCINLLVDESSAAQGLLALQTLCGGVIEKVIVEQDIALIAVVGEGLVRREGLHARVFSAVAAQKINVLMVSAGASEVAYYFIINDKDVSAAVNAIHNEFFSTVA